MVAAIAAMITAASPAASQDVRAGKTIFKNCMACHATDAKTNKVGPHLGDALGRTAGTVVGFNYSKAMKDAGAGGPVWDEGTLAEFLGAPKVKVPGTKMAFAGLNKPQEITDIIAYLKTLPE